MFDRRQHARQPIQRPAKVQHPLNGRYLPAETIDLSAGGASLRVNDPARLQPGQEVVVGVADQANQPLLARRQMRRARVVRRFGRDQHQYVAVAFDEPAEQILSPAG